MFPASIVIVSTRVSAINSPFVIEASTALLADPLFVIAIVLKLSGSIKLCLLLEIKWPASSQEISWV